MPNGQEINKSPPLIVVLSLSFPIEDVRKDIDILLKTVKCPVKACMHGKRLIAFVVVTHETIDQFLSRIKTVIDELGGIEDYWLFPAPNPDDVRGRAGHVSPLAHWLRMGWVETRQLGKSKDVGHRQRRQG
jgi:hypothetical protein